MPEVLPTGLDAWEAVYRTKDIDGLLHCLEILHRKEIEILANVINGDFTPDGALRLMSKEQQKTLLLFDILREKIPNE